MHVPVRRECIILLGLRGSRLDMDTIRKISEVERRHRSAIRIQSMVRGKLSRIHHVHKRHPLWPALSRELEVCSPGLLPVLSRYRGVRWEWSIYPAAWLHMLRSIDAADVLREILDECIRGLW